jgi:hypothetical protein
MRITKIPILILFIFLLPINFVAGKRRISGRNWQFEARPGMGNLVLEGEEEQQQSESEEENGGMEDGNENMDGGITDSWTSTMVPSMDEKREMELNGNRVDVLEKEMEMKNDEGGV